jgi:hypothetical protein
MPFARKRFYLLNGRSSDSLTPITFPLSQWHIDSCMNSLQHREMFRIYTGFPFNSFRKPNQYKDEKKGRTNSEAAVITIIYFSVIRALPSYPASSRTVRLSLQLLVSLRCTAGFPLQSLTHYQMNGIQNKSNAMANLFTKWQHKKRAFPPFSFSF